MESERGLQRSGCQCKRPCEINVSQPGEINNWLTRSNKPSVSKHPNTGSRPFVGDLLRLANQAAPHPCKDCPFNLTRRFKTSWTERSLPLLFPCQMRCSVVWQDPSHKAMSTSRRRTYPFFERQLILLIWNGMIMWIMLQDIAGSWEPESGGWSWGACRLYLFLRS